MANINSPERLRRERNAMYEGRLAKQYGEPQSACPYKRSEFGLGFHWDKGWEEAVEGDFWVPPKSLKEAK